MGPYLSTQTPYDFWHVRMEEHKFLSIAPIGHLVGVVSDISYWKNPPFPSFYSMLNPVVKT